MGYDDPKKGYYKCVNLVLISHDTYLDFIFISILYKKTCDDSLNDG